MTQKNRQLALKNTLGMARKIVESSPMTLAKYGVAPEEFAQNLQEAVLNNPNILEASESSLANAIRKCCRDGLIPDGDSAVISVFKGEASVMPMVTGIRRMAHQMLGAEIRSGVVYEGDEIEIVDGAGVDTKVVVKSGMDVFKSRKADNVIGAWCWVKLPNESRARITLYSQDEIERTRKASFSKSGPWATWPDRMAEKACVKSAIWKLRYLVNNSSAEPLFQTLREDDAEIVDVTPEKQPERQVEEKQVEEKPAPKPRRKPAQKPAPKPKEEPKEEPKQEIIEPEKKPEPEKEAFNEQNLEEGKFFEGDSDDDDFDFGDMGDI